MKQYALLVLLVLMGNYGWGQGSENLNSNFKGSYDVSPVGNNTADDVTLNTGSWRLFNMLAGNSASDRKNGTYSARIKGTGEFFMNFNETNGIGDFSFYYARYGTDSGLTIQVSYSINDGANWIDVGSSFSTTSVTSLTLATVAVNVSGNVRIKLTFNGNSSNRCNIDDISWTTYSAPSNIAPIASAVSFSGTNNVGQTLTGTYTYTDTDSDLEGISTFQWYRADDASGLNSVAISGETNPTYTLQAADNGKYIRFGVVPVAASGTSPGVEAFSSWQGPVTDPSAVTISVVETITPFANTCVNQFSSSQSYTVSASNLTENITITAPTHFEISTDDATWTTSIALTPTSGTIGATTLYVRFIPTAVGAQSGNLSHVSAGATTQNIALNGEGINSSPTITTPTSTSITVSSAVLGGNVTVVGCTPVIIRGIEYSTTSGFSNGSGTVVSESGTFSTGTFTVNVTGLTSGTTYYYKAFATSASGTSYTTEASFSTLAIAAPLALNATGVGATSFTATWDAVLGATGYEIDVYAIDAGANATDLFISEYVEGSSNNKYIEIFNGTGADVDLSDYDLDQYNNGSTTLTTTLSLSGTLTNGSVYVIRNNSATIWTGTSNLSTTSTVMGYNGNDVIALRKQSLNIDVVGTIGNSTDFAKDATLRRNSNLSSPTTSYNVSDWTVLPSDTVDGLGSHTFDGGSSISYILQNQNIGNVTSYQITGLDQNTAYYYVVRALDATSESVNSNEITTTTALVSTTWNGTTWSNGAPTSTVDAIIDGDFSTTGNFICKDLTLNSGKILTINAADKLSVMEDLVNEGSIVFKSNATSTGRFDSYTGAAIAGSGTVTMERYIDGKRAYRLLAPGVSTAGTIAENWQQQVFITGSTSTTGADGFDATTTGNPSMFTYENTGWAPISNTNVLTLDATKGYRMLIRGDRTPSILTSPSNGNMNTPVTLSTTGTMVTGEVTFNTLPNQNYTLVANPYISPINWATVTKTGISDTYYAWDPNLGTGNQRGRYVSCDVLGATSIISDNGNPNTDVDQYIQPGQAFFIEKAATGVHI